MALAATGASAASDQEARTRDERSAPPPPSAKLERIRQPVLELRNEWTKTRSADAPSPETQEERGREQIGRLVYSKLTLEIEDVPLRDALRALRRELGLNMVLFTAEPAKDAASKAEGQSLRPGFDGDQTVSITLSEVDGRAALEALLAFAGSDTTWQLHNGIVEIGPRSQLARPEARETRVYDTTDLAIDPPDWRPGRQPNGGSRAVELQRRNSDEVIGELVGMIVAHCEPDAFLPAPPETGDPASGPRGPMRHSTPSSDGGGRGGAGRRSPNSPATANFDPAEAQVFVRGRWASIQAKDNKLAVTAPDFVHRAIDGYPNPIAPPPAR